MINFKSIKNSEWDKTPLIEFEVIGKIKSNVLISVDIFEDELQDDSHGANKDGEISLNFMCCSFNKIDNTITVGKSVFPITEIQSNAIRQSIEIYFKHKEEEVKNEKNQD